MCSSKTDSENLILNQLEETYRELLENDSAYCIDVEKTLETGALFLVFDIRGRAKCERLEEYFSLFIDIVEKQNLSRPGRQELDNRFKKALKEKLEEQTRSKKSSKYAKDRQRMAYTDDKVRSLLADLAAADNKLLVNGLGILVKDTDQFLSSTEGMDGQTGAEEFRKILEEVTISDKRSPADSTYQYLKADKTVPTGFAKAASTGSVDLSGLLNPKVMNKAATSTGRKFLKRFMRHFKKVLCEGSDSPYENFKHSRVTQAALPTTIATTILTTGFSIDTFWYPLAVYLGLLTVRTGLETVCDKKPIARFRHRP